MNPNLHRATRTPVIALHSSAATGRQWRALHERLGPERPFVAPDLHGHGDAPAWSGRPEDIVAADVARVSALARAASRPVHLVGHSYGGAVALGVAVAHPELVASLAVYEPVVFRVLFDRHGRARPAAEVHEVARSMRAWLRADRYDGAAARFVDFWSGEGAWRALDATRQSAVAARMPTVAMHFAALAASPLRLADYAAIDIPLTLMVGERTRAATRRIGELLASVWPHAERVAMSAMGHTGPITHAHTVAQRIAYAVAQAEQAFEPARRAA